MAIDKYHSKREKIDIDELTSLNAANTVFLDSQRVRPLWFDGRFARAADFNRQTEYFLTRQADLSIATGTGVVEGLMVSMDGENNRLTITPGFGVTEQGERVVIAQLLNIQLSNITHIRQLNIKLGLSQSPKAPLRSLNGIYLVVLRPLEYTANPIAAYPDNIGEKRQFHDGDIIEATALSLIEIKQNFSHFANGASVRAQLADSLFNRQESLEIPPNTLPLALIQINNGLIKWIDNHLARREMGSAFSDVLGLGIAPRGLRHAHFKQYQQMYFDILQQRGSNDSRFAASDYFLSLPSAGQMPTACIDIQSSTQYFFPDKMDVEISVIPDDEVAPLIEESLLLPPIELDADAKQIDATAVMILIPVPRIQFNSVLNSLKKQVPAKILNKTRIERAVSTMSPRERLSKIQRKLPEYIQPSDNVIAQLNEVDWQSLLGVHENIWFVRRRHLSYKEEVAGKAVNILADEFGDETEMRRYLTDLGLYDDFVHLKIKGSAAADMNMVRLLTIPKFTQSELLMRSALLEYKAEKRLSEQAVNRINDRFTQQNVGEGIRKIEPMMQLDQQATIALALSKSTPELDYVAQHLPEESLINFAEEIKSRVSGDKPQTPTTLAKFIKSKMKELQQ
ncbi:hypothetical protein [Aliikangiella maris]